jgi:hypothetical protein
LTDTAGRAASLLGSGMPVRAVAVELSRPALSSLDVEVAAKIGPSAGAERKCEDATAVPITV